MRSVGKTKAHLWFLFDFSTFCHEELFFWLCYRVLTSSWGPKYPHGPHMDWYTYISLVTNQNTDFVCEFIWEKRKEICEFGSFFLLSHFVIFFGSFLVIFDPPLYLILGLGSLYGPLPRVWSLDCGISKKKDLDYWFCYVFSIFFTFMVIFSHFGPLGGSLRALSNSYGHPRATMNSLTSRDTLPPGLVLPLVQLDKFVDDWGLPKWGNTKKFNFHNNHLHHSKWGVPVQKTAS